MRVVAALIVRDGRVLICQRGEGKPFPLKWEFPGGKVEEGETLAGALARELKEELEIEIESAREIFCHDHVYRGGVQVHLFFFRVDRYNGAIANRVFHDIRWAGAGELSGFDFLDGDLPLIEKIVGEGIPA